MISRVVNDTMQRIDTDQLVKKIRIELLRSGKVVVTTAVGGAGPEDSASVDGCAAPPRQTRSSTRAAAALAALVAPDYSPVREDPSAQPDLGSG